MASISRYPFATRLQPSQSLGPLDVAPRSVSGTKRPHSPEPTNEAPKRHRASHNLSTAAALAQRERKQQDRQDKAQREAEFRDKYTRAFPAFIFYFDTESMQTELSLKAALQSRVDQLGATREDFFSKHISHLITNKPDTVPASTADKENVAKPKHLLAMAGGLKSPIKFKSRTTQQQDAAGFDIVAEAKKFGIKVWTTEKLASVISRCLGVPNPAAPEPHSTIPVAPERSLTRLLQSERRNGTTERDPTQRRHDFVYFTKGSYFTLVEDTRQELATIAVQEYANPRGRDGDGKVPWPVLHCHPHARGPFIPFDEKEKRRWERTRQNEMDRHEEREEETRKRREKEVMKRKAEANLRAKKSGDLRRSVSMNNLHRRVSNPDLAVDLDADDEGSANASGYLASGTGGYMAASGNSVGITSTTGTTSTSTAGYPSRNQLPPSLRARVQHEVVTSRRQPSAKDDQRVSVMGPPACVPERRGLLKKSRSMNTMRLPKREEGSKPGYCESCRTKFEDFKMHIEGKRHRKFALNDAHFSQLDCVLARVKRRTIQEVENDRNIKRDDDSEDDEVSVSGSITFPHSSDDGMQISYGEDSNTGLEGSYVDLDD